MKLRFLQLKDSMGMLEWMQDSSISSVFQFDSSTVNEETCKEFIKSTEISNSNLHFAIVDEFDEYIGTISLKNIYLVNLNAEYAIVLRAKGIGKEYSKIATDIILYIAFELLHLHKVYLYVFKDNYRAIRFYDKYGFIKEGEFLDSHRIRGNYRSTLWYRLTRDEFLQKDVDMNIREYIDDKCLERLEKLYANS
jgi:diamine N-acetyltransferase